MVLVTQQGAGLAQGIGAFGQAVGAGLQKRGERQALQAQREKQGTILSEEIAKLTPESSPIEIIGGINRALKQGVPMETIKGIIPLLTPQLKAAGEQQQFSQLMGQLGIGQPQQQQQAQQQQPQQAQQQFGGQTILGDVVGPAGSEEVAQQQAQQQQLQPQQQQQQAPRTIHDLSSDEIAMLAANPNRSVAKTGELEIERRGTDRKEFVDERKFHTEQTKDIRKRMESLRETLPKKEFVHRMALDAVRSGDVGALSKANLADRFNLPELQSASGAQLSMAIKENLVTNMSRVSAKAQNVWMEKMMSSAFARIGSSKDANEMALEVFAGEKALDQANLDMYDRLAKEDVDKFGYVRDGIAERVTSSVASAEEEIINKTSYRTRKIFEREQGIQRLINKKVPKGTYLTPRMLMAMSKKYNGSAKKVKENALKLGYTIVTDEEHDRWGK